MDVEFHGSRRPHGGEHSHTRPGHVSDDMAFSSPRRALSARRRRIKKKTDLLRRYEVHDVGRAPICCITPRRSGWPRSPTIRPSAR